jgi:hypothetical protein
MTNKSTAFRGSKMETALGICFGLVIIVLGILLLKYIILPLIIMVVFNSYALLLLALYGVFFSIFSTENRWLKFIFRLSLIISASLVLFAIVGGILMEKYTLFWVDAVYSFFVNSLAASPALLSFHNEFLFKVNVIIVLYTIPLFLFYICNSIVVYTFKPLFSKSV